VYREFFAYDPLFHGGVFVTGGDLNGDGKAEVITGMGSNGNGRLTVYDGKNGRQLRSFMPDSTGSRSSVRVNVFDFDHDGDQDIVTGIRNEMTAFDGKTYVRTGGMTPFDPRYTGGVFFG